MMLHIGSLLFHFPYPAPFLSFAGFISGLGLAVDQQSVSIIQLQKVLISLIEKAGKAKEGSS